MKSPSPVVSFPGEALAVEPIINVVAGCMPRPLTFDAEAATIHVGTAEAEKSLPQGWWLPANGHPLAIFVEQEIVQSPAIFRVFYSLFPDEMFKIGLNGKFPVNWVMWKKAFSSSSPWAMSRARDVG